MFRETIYIISQNTIGKIHNISSQLNALLQSLLECFIKKFSQYIYGNLLKGMKIIKNYYSVMLLYETDYYKSNQNDCYKIKDERKKDP